MNNDGGTERGKWEKNKLSLLSYIEMKRSS